MCPIRIHQPSRNRVARPLAASDIPNPHLFWEKVKQGDGCWEWQGNCDLSGYGYHILKRGGRPIKCHRIAFALANGPIPPGLFVRHTCDNPPCVRPDHLLLGTAADNTQDAMARRRLYCMPRAQNCRDCGAPRESYLTNALCRNCYNKRYHPDIVERLHRRLANGQSFTTRHPHITRRRLQDEFGERNAMWFARNYGLFGFGTPITAAQIAAEAGVSRQRVHQVLIRMSKRLGLKRHTFWSKCGKKKRD